MGSVALSKIVEQLDLKNVTPDVDISKIRITLPEINRPALQLTGYFDHFDSKRVKIIGYVEYTYLEHLSRERKLEIYEQFLSYEIPCLIYTTKTKPDEDMLRMAVERNIPIFTAHKTTTSFMAEIIRRLNVELAPCISIHGVLVDIYGEGVLIMGESGIGKSEAALELIRRGHRLVTDDVVEIRKINGNTLVGTSPDITRYFIELRGIGIIDARRIFGMGAVKPSEKIDMVIQLEAWDSTKAYDRLGLDNEYANILGVKIPAMTVPITPGRNLAVIVETAAMNNRQKKMGYNAAKDLMLSLGMDDVQPVDREIEIWQS